MSQHYTEEQIRQFQEDDLAAQRIRKLGFGFHGVPTCADHENYLKLSTEDRESWKNMASKNMQTNAGFDDTSVTSDLDMAEYTDDNDLGLQYKWSWIKGSTGEAFPYKVIADTSSTWNWISQNVMLQLRFKAIKANPVICPMMDGNLASDTYVDVPWTGKDGHQGIARCRVAPRLAQFDGLLFGQNFFQQHPDALFDEQPDRRLLLTIQAKPNVRM